MSYSYEIRRPKQTKASVSALIPHGPSMDALRSGAVKPTQEQRGNRVDLPDAIRSKMEDAFGADLSAVKLYESRAVEDAGANAVTRGSDIAFAPGMLDFSSYGGQALLGHEISHVVSQTRGEVTGAGFLNDPALEARADREGAMAAAGQQVAVPATAVSSASPSAGPMQASKKRRTGREPEGIELEDFSEAPRPEKKAPESNGAFETAVGAIADQTDFAGMFADSLPNAAAFPQAIMQLGGAYEALDQAKKSGTRQDIEDAKLDLASSGLGAMEKSTALVSNTAGQFNTAAAQTVGTVAQNMGSAFGIGVQGISLFRNARQLKDAAARKRRMAASVRAMKQRAGSDMSEDDREKIAIFRQGKRNAGIDEEQSAFDTVTDTLGLTGTVLGLAGAPVGSAFAGAQTAVKAVGDEVVGYEKDRVRKKTVEEKYHAKEKYLRALDSDEHFREMGVSKRAFKRKYLKALGAGHGSKEEAYQVISGSRADKLLEGIRNGEDWAIEFAGNAGIDLENVGKSADHDKAIRDSLLKALSGSKEEQEFHSSDAREYNAFEVEYMKNALESVKTGGKKALTAVKRTGKGAWDLMKRGFRGAKNLLTSSEARSDAWKKLKTGAMSAAGKVRTGVVNAGKAIGRGAVGAYEGAKSFITDADARYAAWESVKTGAGKAASFASNVVRHSVKSRLHGIRNWYREGVDQMNVHGDTYKQMGLMDRFLWSAMNLPARITHGLTGNRAATARRMKENEDAEAAVAYLMQKEKQKH